MRRTRYRDEYDLLAFPLFTRIILLRTTTHSGIGICDWNPSVRYISGTLRSKEFICKLRSCRCEGTNQ